MNCFDVYRILEASLETYLDSIAIIEDPTDEERKNYEDLNDWMPAKPDENLVKILKSLNFTTEQNGQEK